MLGKTVLFIIVLFSFVAAGCGPSENNLEQSGQPPAPEYAPYLGEWKSVNPVAPDSMDFERVVIRESGEHLVFEFFKDGTSMKCPATYESGFFSISVSSYRWSAFLDQESGYLIIEFQEFEKDD